MNAVDLAKAIVKTLTHEGYLAYFAGGWVRDYVMGHPSQDIDIATNAPPEKIVTLFPKTIPVGISFGVVVVVMDEHQFEVSTFRKDVEYVDGRRPSSIELTSPQEDALRRDFTINGLFYDPLKGEIIDYVHGKEDIRCGIVRTIGRPGDRFLEDRLRMIRAVRFAARFGFLIDEETERAVQTHAATLLPAVSIERVWQELKKMAAAPRFEKAILDLHRLGLLAVIFSELSNVSADEIKQRIASFSAFSSDVPAVLYIMELFPDADVETQLNICTYLKISLKNQKLVEYVDAGRRLVQKDREKKCEDVEWARFYAQPDSQLALQVIAARLPEEDRPAFLSRHQARMGHLQRHIERMSAQTPLVTADDLQKEGVVPSKKLGDLLKEAERIAVNNDLHEKREVIAKLKRTPLW